MLHNPYSNHYHAIDNPVRNELSETSYSLRQRELIITLNYSFSRIHSPWISRTVSSQASRSSLPVNLTSTATSKPLFLIFKPKTLTKIKCFSNFLRLRIDLNCRNGQTAFHFNPRIGQGCVVRNSNLGGWGPEEKNGPFVFRKGQAYEIIILVEADKYRVAVNGVHSYEYRHRVGYQEVTRLSIAGDVKTNRVVLSGVRNQSKYLSGEFERFLIIDLNKLGSPREPE